MAEKILQTRIINKHAALENWKTSELPLKTGEIALAYVETTKPDGHGGSYTVPTYLMKVGHDNKKFSELEWLAAPASDVHAWAKAATKPSYIASEIARGQSTVAADLGKAEEAIQTLQAAVGSEGSVASMIKAAIEALDVTDAAVEKQFVTAVAEADGKISVTRRALTADDIPTLAIAKIDGLEIALAGKVATGTFTEYTAANNLAVEAAQNTADAAQEHSEGVAEDLADYIESNDAALAEVKATATTVGEVDAQIDAKLATFKTNEVTPVAERVSDLETTVGDANSGLVKALADEVTRATEAEDDLDERLTAAEGAIASLNAATTLEGVGPLASRPAAGKVAGAIWIATDNNKEYVWDGSKWVELGDTTAELTEINNLKERATALENDLKEGGATFTKIATAQSTANKGVADAATAQAAANAAQADATDALNKLAIVQGEGAGSIKKAESDANAYTDGKISDVEETINDLTQTVNTNAQTAAEATQDVAQDLAAYKLSNNTAVEAAQNAADAAQDAADAAQQYAEGVNTALTNLVTTGQVNINKEAIATNAADIDTIEANYARVADGKLVYGQGDAVMTIIFDCGNEIA